MYDGHVEDVFSDWVLSDGVLSDNRADGLTLGSTV